MVELWVEKYRPKTLDEYVWLDAGHRAQVEQWLEAGSLPHLLLSGGPGTGKTSLAKLLLRMLNVQPGDILDLNASRERNVDTVQDKVLNFVQTWPLGRFKYVLLDEADSMSPLAQRVLRNEMERYHDTVRFALTCNYKNKILPALHSRCQTLQFDALDRDGFVGRVGDILSAENVDFDSDTVLSLIDASYPDLRKCINMLQQNTRNGRLEKPETVVASKDYLIDMATLFKAGHILDARKLIVEQAQPEEYEEIFRFLYRNLELWGSTQGQQDDALLAIRHGLVNHALVADPEINLAATICELGIIAARKI